jgi:hypothetical protein
VIEEPNLIRGDTYLAPRSEKKYSSQMTSEDGDSGCGDLATFRKWTQTHLIPYELNISLPFIRPLPDLPEPLLFA